jgi:hypothetical protein
MEDPMSRLKTALPAGLALLFVSLYSTPGASAIKFQWSVQGTGLAAGTVLPTIIKHDPTLGTIVLKTKEFGVATELESSALKSTGTNIQGGTPGTGEGVITFENIKVLKPSECEVENITTNNVTSTIVEGTGEAKGKPLILLRPAKGTVFWQFAYKLAKGGKECSLAGDTANMTGSILLEPLSTASEEQPLWTFEKSEGKSLSSTGTESTNNLELAGGGKTAIANISGNIWVLLESNKPFSAL